MSKLVTELYGVRAPNIFDYRGGEAECVGPDLVVGVEIETERVDTWSGWRTVREEGSTDLLNSLGVVTTSDGSLRGQSAEFITKPMKLKHALHALNRFFDETKYGEDNFTDRTSVHVHANCTDMTADQLAAVALLYSVVEEALFEFVGNYRDTNIYCVPWYQCRNHNALIYNCLNNPHGMRQWQKYTALNYLPLTTQGTIEFRHMHGTSDMKKLTTWANLISSLMLNGKAAGYEAIAAEIGELNTNSQYRSFFEKMLSGQLPFSGGYDSLLEKGVIQAKYSIFTNNTTKKPEAVPEPEAGWTIVSRNADGTITEGRFDVNLGEVVTRTRTETANEVLERQLREANAARHRRIDREAILQVARMQERDNNAQPGRLVDPAQVWAGAFAARPAPRVAPRAPQVGVRRTRLV